LILLEIAATWRVVWDHLQSSELQSLMKGHV
jgi:hypothetical protein